MSLSGELARSPALLNRQVFSSATPGCPFGYETVRRGLPERLFALKHRPTNTKGSMGGLHFMADRH